MILSLVTAVLPASSAPEPIGFLIDAHGDVMLRRLTWSQSRPVGLGIELRLGDTIRLKANAKAMILCPDLLTSWQPSSKSDRGVFEGCPAGSETIRMRDGQEALGVRNSEPEPSVLMPSNSAILDPKPWIRWEAVPGTNRYRVSVWDSSNPSQAVWGPALVNGTSIQYPGKPALTMGLRYFVRVTADGGLSTQGRPFFLASGDLQHTVEERMRKLKAAIAEEVPREVAIAVYLLSQRLTADALPLLDGLAGKSHSAALQLLRAKSLGEVGAKATEIEALRRALKEADQNNQPESKAECLLELARLAIKRSETMELSRRAARIFRELGDTTRAEAAEKLGRSEGGQ
ncbi:MAG: hypothetical protein WB973_13495 [Thermoanaerobaculia bacterium]